MPRFFVCTKKAKLCCDTWGGLHREEFVHSKVFIILHCVAEILSHVEDGISFIRFIGTRTSRCYVLGHTASDIYAKIVEVYRNLISCDIVKR